MVKQRKKKYPDLDLSVMLPDGLVDCKRLAERFVSKKKKRAAIQ